MKIHNLSREDVFLNLVTSENGLSSSEARKRLNEFGPNEIRETSKTPLTVKFLRQFTHLLAVLLWIGAGLSFISEALHPGEGMLNLGLAIVAVIILNAIFTFIQEYRAEKAIEILRQLLPFQVRVIREGREVLIVAREVVPGDVILLSEGLKVPADARIIESANLMANNAPLTGEAEPVPLDSKPFCGELIESRNIAFAGSSIVSGRGCAVVFASGMSSEFGRIARLTSAVETGMSPLQKEIVKITRFIAVMASVMGIVFFMIGRLIGRSFWENFIFTIGLIVANVPEGLLPTVTLALVMGGRRMLKKKVLIKTLASVETLGSVTFICTDKTGTLTLNNMDLRQIAYGDRVFAADQIRSSRAEALFTTAYLCNNACHTDGRYIGDPTEVAILRASREFLGSRDSKRVFEIPFDSERKRMTTVNLVDGRTKAFTKGAAESIIPLCTHILLDGKSVPLEGERLDRIAETCRGLMDSGLRVLAFSYRDLGLAPPVDVHPKQIESGMVFAGLIGLEDPPRPEVREAVARCHGAGIKIAMITGDASRTAVAIAREIGLLKGEPEVIEGRDLATMSDRQLADRISGKEIIFARMTPKHKMRVVSVLQEMGERVAVTGDGVNDAPALKKADIGIAMGIAGTDVAKEAADMILLDDNFATIVNAIEEGRTVFENIRKFITYIFAHGTPEAIPYILFALIRIPLPLTVMQILAIDLGTETIPALALGVEPPESDVMKRPPRPRDKGLINSAVLIRGYLFLGFISTAGVLTAYFHVLLAGGWYWGMALPADAPLARQASTATFLSIVLMQIGTALACRTMTQSVAGRGLLSNSLMLWGILTEVLLSIFIIYHPWANRLFSTAPLGISVWLIMVPFMLLVIVADETRKYLYRGKVANKD
ncbi:MAG: cation-transporting P-type ATPase [Nitrospiraceae bacterium]|nr:cation-transporting P-type ATPase [Nitrospiraceae bacterium]